MSDGLSDDERARLAAREAELAQPKPPTKEDMFRDELMGLVRKYDLGVVSCSCCGIWIGEVSPDSYEGDLS